MTDQLILERLQKIEASLDRVNAPKEYMDINGAAYFTSFEVSTLYSYVNQRKIPFMKKNGKLVFKREVLARWLEEDSFEPDSSKKRSVGAKKVNIRM
jgi:hypothetical protein